jgi:hypothetical protein
VVTVAERKWTHGLSEGFPVEILHEGKPSRPRECGTVLLLKRAGFTTFQHPGVVHWFVAKGVTWRHWTEHERAIDANVADVGSTNNPKPAT